VVKAALVLASLAPALVVAEDELPILDDIWNPGSKIQRGDMAGDTEVSTEHSDLDDPSLFGEDYSGDGEGKDECWEYCHPDVRNPDGVECNHCPSPEEPSRWREVADLGIGTVQCSTDLASLSYDLSDLIEVGWVDENWHLEMSFSSDSDLLEPHKSKEYEISTEPESYKNRSLKAEITGLCSSYQYNVCLQLIKDESLKTEPFCQVCMPKGPPPENPSSISVDGGITYMDVHWERVSLKCPDLVYQVLINGSMMESTKEGTDQTRKWVSGIDMQMSRLEPGLHNISVRTLNIDGESPGELSYVTYETFEVTPPTMLDPITTIENGQLQTEIMWEHSMNFKERELTKQWYSVILNNMSSVDTEGEVLDSHELHVEADETSLMVNLSMAEGWNTTFSVVTHLGDVDSAATDPARLFPDYVRPGPPQQVIIQHEVVEGSLRAVVNWQYELPLGEGFDGLKMLVHLKDGEGELLDTKEVDWPATSVELELNPSLPWETNISLQTAVLNSALEEAGERKLFGGEMELLPPKEGSVKVEHRVTQDGGLEAIISWENNMDPVFDHLQTVVEVTDGETGYLTNTKRVDFPANSVVIGLEEVQAWASNFTIYTTVMGGRGEATEEQPLFSDLPLSPPDMVQVETVIEEGILKAVVSWNNTVMDGDLTTKEFNTEVKLLDKEDNILDTITVPYPDTGFSYELKDIPWDVRFILTTLGKEEEGESSFPKALFSDNVDLTVPEDISLQHGVENNVLKATLSWKPVPEAFDRLVTVVKLYDKEEELYDLPKFMPAGESSLVIEHGKPWAVKWGRLYTLTTCVKSATEEIADDCGEETAKQPLFPNHLLQSPKNIRVEHGFDAEVQSAFAVVQWENTIMDEFEGLATLFNSWVPDPDDHNVDLGDSSARRRRQTENSSPLPPGHYRPQLFRYSETSKQIYLIDVDQRTMFSLQAVINDSVMVLGEESDPQPLFDESLVKIGPPSGVEVQQVIENGTLTSTVNWSPSPLNPPTKMTIYPGEEGKEPIRTIDLDPSETETSLDLDASLPADATFTLASSFKPGQWEEGERQRLFLTFPTGETSSQPHVLSGRTSGMLELTPPVITTITVLPSSNSSASMARVEWNHTTEEFSLLHTRVSVWWENGSLYEALDAEGTEIQLEVFGEAVIGARVSLQASVNGMVSKHSPRKLLFSEEEGLSWILMIVALCILLLLYIIFTYFCLRRLCNRRGGMAPEKQKKSDCDAEPGTPGVYSPARWEEKPLMGNGRSKSGLSSDAGSDHTDQSLLSEEPGERLSPGLLLLPGDSMITLNKFNEDDDDGFFLGGFNEDGSFIGDYMDTDPETNRAVMNRLVGFQQLFSKKC